ISIIIPTYNRASIIEECLNSVSNQSYRNWECLVVDDFSTDSTKELINNIKQIDKRFIYLQNSYAKGAPGARNTGLAAAKGQYITFLDSDDAINNNCLETRLTFAIKHNADITVGLQRIFADNIEKNLVNIDSEKHALIRFFSYLPNCDIPWI